MTTPTWATTLVHGACATHGVPAPPRVRGDAAGMPFHEASRLRAAAHHARRVYPGALGELVARELRAYADFGCRLGDDALAARLATQVLTTRAG
ncbi:hypothetical protein [Actinomycetospora cinnamomea]|uniref:Uncharacterized protein n=1 Tax=Actinomycetospora cinnamomea TaxID=663609 RepID=A0A2U1EVE2_9PSEU|nr:hypothetical protein [Actinomycetospora cinnamomea]PVZ03914.1 hypothetical protein C8D89_11923 [Actinomycetospora cinnamomea]